MASKDLRLALSFRSAGDRNQHIISEPTIVKSWGFDDLENDIDADEFAKKPPWGAVVGCNDGALYIFHPDLSKATKRQKSFKLRRLSGEGPSPPYRRTAHLSLSRSRNASPASSRTNLPVSTNKSRAVSGLTKTEVEAPKNYVDFEEEQEKMKSMVADRSIREAKDRSPRSSMTLTADTPAQRFDDAKSVSSIPSTSSLMSTPLSPPLSPGLDAQRIVHSRKNVRLQTRVTPRDYGFGHAVIAMEILEEGELVLALQESGKLSVFRTLDGISVASAHPGDMAEVTGTTVVAHGAGSRILWTWYSCYVMQSEFGKLVITLANADSRTTALDSGEADEKTRITIYDLRDTAQYKYGDIRITRRHEVVLENLAEGIAFCQELDHSLKLYLVDRAGQLFVRPLDISMVVKATHTDLRQQTKSSPAVRDLSISLPLAIKEFVSRSELPSPADESKGNPESLADDIPHLIATLPLTSKIEGLRIRKNDAELMGLAWSASELLIFDIEEASVSSRCLVAISSGLQEVVWVDGSTVTAFHATEVISYKIPSKSSSASTSEPSGNKIFTKPHSPALTSTAKTVFEHKAKHQLLCVDIAPDLQRITILSHPQPKDRPRESQPISVWSFSDLKKPSVSRNARLTALMPLGHSIILCGYDNGQLLRFSMKDLVNTEWQRASPERNLRSFAVTSLFVARNLRTGEQFVIGGGDDGSISVWDITTLKLRARWIIFTEPLKQVIQLEADVTGRLRGCCLAVSGDGTIAVIVIDGLDLLYVVPGSPAPLRTVCLNSNSLLLFYADNRTRLWDVKTHEFRRSMTAEKATEMLGQGDWVIADIHDGLAERSGNSMLAALNRSRADGVPPPALLFDVDEIMDNSPLGVGHVNKKASISEYHQALLSALHSFGLDDHIDTIFTEYAGPGASKRSTDLSVYDSDQNLQTFFPESAHAVWQISCEVTAARLLCLLGILHAESNARDDQRAVHTLISFYDAALPMLVGPNYSPPSLVTLVHYRNESRVSEVRLAAKQLFECELARLSNDDIAVVVENWRHMLPCLLPDNAKQSDKASLSLSLCANIAIEKYSLLSTTTLTDIAKSITIYLYDEHSPHRALAIELCSRGFEVWQQYFDAMEALRSIFTLATTTRKESISVRNPGPQARMAVLQIASSNSPLFMTTLSLDILHPRSVEYNKSVMQVIAFVIKKNPLVLHPNLPRLMEAVVKSLDPGSNADREAVLDTVTEIIALVVQTFPTVDFHAGSQRLAVGTSEGAVIMYDLKTATRLYVLEGHRKRLAGLSFSPDGRRMVTISLSESVVLVWKVGTSFVSLFNPGAPPRQGRSGSEPFKTLSFVLKDEALLSVEAALKQVHFSWPSDRTVKIEISDTTFTFST